MTKIKQISDPLFGFEKASPIIISGTIEKADYKAISELDANLNERCELQNKLNLKADYIASKIIIG